MAYIRKVKNGWRAEVERAGVRVSATRATKAEAQAWAVTEEAAILAGARGEFPRKTLGDAIDRYLREVTAKKAKLRPDVARADRLRFEAWMRDFPWLAEKVLSEITTTDLAKWRDARMAQVSESSVLRELQLYRPLWGLAIDEWKWAGTSPWKGLRLPRKAHARRRSTMWQEVRLLVRSAGYVRTIPPNSPSQQAIWAYMVALHTALRSAEILRMSRSTVDLEKRVYRLPRHKTDDAVGERLVPFTRRAARVLQVLDVNAAALGRDAYFTISDASRDQLWRRARDRVMVDGLRFHDSRAAALTWLARRYDVMTLAKISGHADINELYRTYYRESPQAIAARL